MRTSKTANGVTKTYILVGSFILQENIGSNSLKYYYGNGNIIGFSYNGIDYFYRKNLQGDITEIYTSSGAKVASYVYDAWGNHKIFDANGNEVTSTTHIGYINPIRYRGYYFDVETGLYYVKERYYDPEIGRWINADSVIAGIGSNIKGYNLFTYCFNNPVNMDDSTGQWPKWIKNTVKWVAKNIVKPVVKTVQKTLSKVDATYSRGINVSGTTSAFIFNLQAGISIDTKGNVAIQGSAGGGVTSGSPGASITKYQSVTNAPSIDKLEGPSYQIGGSVGVPVFNVPLAAGGDFNIIPDSALNTTYFGATTNVGFGTPGGEFHVEWGETVTWNATRFNIFDLAKNVYIKIMEG